MESRQIIQHLFLTTENIIHSMNDQNYSFRLRQLEKRFGLTFLEGQFTYFLTEKFFYIYEGKLDGADPALSCFSIDEPLYENLIQFYCQYPSAYSSEDFFHLGVDSEMERLFQRIILNHLAIKKKNADKFDSPIKMIDVTTPSDLIDLTEDKEIPEFSQEVNVTPSLEVLASRVAGLGIMKNLYTGTKQTSTVILDHADSSVTAKQLYDLLMNLPIDLGSERFGVRCEVKNNFYYLHKIDKKNSSGKKSRKKSNNNADMDWWYKTIEAIKKTCSTIPNSENLLFS